jgi:hypothetical protein
VAGVVLFCHLISVLPTRGRPNTTGRPLALDRMPGPIVGAGYALVLFLVLLLSPEASKAFIYFQF